MCDTADFCSLVFKVWWVGREVNYCRLCCSGYLTLTFGVRYVKFSVVIKSLLDIYFFFKYQHDVSESFEVLFSK